MSGDFEDQLEDDEAEGEGEIAPDLGKLTLEQLLDIARQADDDLLRYDVDLTDLGLDIRAKVDHIVEYLDYCKSRAEVLQNRANAFERRARGFRNKVKALRQYVANVIALDADLRRAETGLQDDKVRVGGNDFEFLLGYDDVAIPTEEPNPALFLQLGKKFIRRSYAWDKDALKIALQNNNEVIQKIAALKKKPKFTIKPKG